MDDVPNILACDVGNTHVKFARIHGEDVGEVSYLRIGDLSSLGEQVHEIWQALDEPKKIAAVSVNPPAMKAMEAAVDETFHQPVLLVGRDLPLPIDTNLPHPGQIGVDRLCGAGAAFDRLGTACVIVDFGTAITVDCVNADGLFMGGAILPGVSLQAESLHNCTAQLPLVTLESPGWVFGRDTREAIVGGVVFGIRGAIRHLIEAYATELGLWPTVIATGGDAEIVCRNVNDNELVQAIVPNLVLRGVAMSYYRSLLK